jgi:hypothetical protein
MKKNFLGLVALPVLALLATSCAQETVETKSGNVLSYGVASGKQVLSRVKPTDAGTLQEDTNGLNVYVYYTNAVNGVVKAFEKTADGDVLNIKYAEATEATETTAATEAGWYYTGTIYHPENPLSHFVTYPDELAAGGIFTTAGQASFDYTVEDGGTDLVAAATATSQDDAEADLSFKHILSQINFKVVAPTDTELSIASFSGIKLAGLKETNTYTLPGYSWGTAGDAEKDVEYTYDLVAEANQDGGYTGVTNAALMLMPQTLAAGSTFTFSYTIEDTAGAVIRSGSNVSVPFSKFTTIPAWVQGTKYLYTISFEDPEKLTYTVAVGSWEGELEKTDTYKVPEDTTN